MNRYGFHSEEIYEWGVFQTFDIFYYTDSVHRFTGNCHNDSVQPFICISFNNGDHRFT